MSDVLGDIGRNVLRCYIAACREAAPPFWHYGELAQKIGMNGKALPVSQSLDKVGDWCAAHGVPNIAVMIVSKDKKDRGVNMPTDSAVRKLGGPAAVQTRVQAFDWAAYDDRALDDGALNGGSLIA